MGIQNYLRLSGTTRPRVRCPWLAAKVVGLKYCNWIFANIAMQFAKKTGNHKISIDKRKYTTPIKLGAS